MPEYAKRIAKGTLTIFVMMIAAAFIGYLLRMFIARNMSVADYGLFYSVFMFVTFFTLFRDVGMNQAIVKFIPEFLVKKDLGAVKSAMIFSLLIQITFSLIVVLTILLFSDAIVTDYFKDARAAEILNIIMLFFITHIFYQVSKFSFQGFQKMKFFALSEFIYISMVLASAIILFNLRGAFPTSVAYAYLAGSVIASVVCFSGVLKIFPGFIKERFEINKQLAAKLIAFSLPVLFYEISNLIIGYTDTLCITFFRTSSEVGLYQVALPISQIMLYFGLSLIWTLFPLISEVWEKKEYWFFSNGIKTIMKIAFIIILPIGLVFTSFPEIVINILFGEKYVGAAVAMQFLSIGFICFTMGLIMATAINGVGKPVINTKIIAFASLFNLAANIILVPIYGILGAAITSMVSYVIYMLLSMYFINREFIKMRIKIGIPYVSMIKTFFGGFLTLILIFLLKSLIYAEPVMETLIIVPIAMGFYLVWVLFAKCIDMDDLKILEKINIIIPDFIKNIIK